MKTALVTGGAGFIGSHLVDRLIAEGVRVHVLDDLSSGRRKNVPGQAEFHELDIRDPKVAEVLASVRPDTVFHFAAQKNVRYSLEHPDEDAAINIVGGVSVLEAARQSGTGAFVFASTGGAIYDESAARPTVETALVRPLSPYGIAKLSFEHYLEAYHRVHELRTVSLRLSNVYGPRQDPKGEAGVVAIFFQNIFNRRKPSIFGTGEQTRDYVYVADVIEACWLASQGKTKGVFNIGTGVETSVNALWDMIARLTKTAVKPENAPGIPGELRWSCLSSAAVRRAIGWEPRTPLEQGLRETAEWFRSEYR